MTAGYTVDRYVDVNALLDGGVQPPQPTVGLRDDGVGLFYAGQVNTLFGEPETGKTWVALAAMADQLARGKSGLVVDMDHNGAEQIVERLLELDVDEAILRNPQRFRYLAPEDAEHMGVIVADAKIWRPSMSLIDSLGELLPLFGASSNSPDDFTRVHALTLKPLAAAGSCVLALDHLAKGRDSQAYGATGTAAKKRAIGGTSIRCVAAEPYQPGVGGRSFLRVSKDRPGGLRKHSPAGQGNEPLAATFVMDAHSEGRLSYRFLPPTPGQTITPPKDQLDDDIAQLRQLEPPASSVRDAASRTRMSWKRAGDALRVLRETGGVAVVLPVAPLQGAATEQHATGVASNVAATSNRVRAAS